LWGFRCLLGHDPPVGILGTSSLLLRSPTVLAGTWRRWQDQMC
jgi:hypothetical protein